MDHPLHDVLGSEKQGAVNTVLATDLTTHVAQAGMRNFIVDTTAGATTLIIDHPRLTIGQLITIFLLVDGGNLTPGYYKGETLTAIGDALTAVSDHVTLVSNGQTYDVIVDVTT